MHTQTTGDAGTARTVDNIDILGVPVSSVSLSEAVHHIDHWIRSRTPGYVTCTGMHGIMESRRNGAVQQAHHNASLVVCDGMPLVWLNRYHGQSHVTRVYGPDLMLAFCKHDAATGAGHRHFFYGGAPGVPEALGRELKRRFPGLQIAGSHSPPYRPLTPEEDDEIVRMIRDSGADIVWVGLSTPKQELWMADHVNKFGRPVLVGVGAAFDFHTGRLVQAPRWMQQSGLEWLFRLLAEPRRLWKRYFRNLPPFLILVLRQMVITRIQNGRTSSSSARSETARTR